MILSALFCGGLSAQVQQPLEPAYKRIPTVPPFSLALAGDSSTFTKTDIRKKKPIIMMVFSPDCDHCVHATEDLITNINSLKNTEIVLASSLSYESVVKFYNDLKLSAYPNIHVGYDSKRFLSSFYEVKSFPSIFLYNKKGNFKEGFEGDVSFEKIAKSL